MKASLVLVEMVAAALLMLATVQVSSAALYSAPSLRARRSSEPEAYESTAAYQSVIQFISDEGISSPDDLALRRDDIEAHIATIDPVDLEEFGEELEKTADEGLRVPLEQTKFKYGEDVVAQWQYMLLVTATAEVLIAHTAQNFPNP